MAYIGKSPTGTGVRSRFYYTQTSGGGTSISGTDDNSKTLTFTDGEYIDVFLNGVLLVAGTDYNTNTANTISGLAALANGDVVEVVVYDIFTVADTVSASQGGTFNASVTIADDLTVDTSTLHVDSTNNRVGVGTVAPSNTLDIEGSGTGLNINSTNDEVKKIAFENSGTTTGYIGSSSSTPLRFLNGSATEHMRIDSSGRLLVGTTDTALYNNTSGDGFIFDAATGSTQMLRDDNCPVFINRASSDGDLISFRKNGTSIGTLATNQGVMYLGSGATGLDFEDSNDAIRPVNASNGNSRDNAIDLGRPDVRFDDIYATNGTIQTSDQNEKQQIASLTTAEMTAAKAISKLFKTFKWNSSVTENGDAARTHSGVIAQEVQTAMTDAGLDATNYAFWCSDTWWETSTDVPAVEADEEAGIEARDAYTRIDTYETADEAPDGATQRTRLGIRYPELLAFIGAATEQRLADIETRLAALEAAE